MKKIQDFLTVNKFSDKSKEYRGLRGTFQIGNK